MRMLLSDIISIRFQSNQKDNATNPLLTWNSSSSSLASLAAASATAALSLQNAASASREGNDCGGAAKVAIFGLD